MKRNIIPAGLITALMVCGTSRAAGDEPTPGGKHLPMVVRRLPEGNLGPTLGYRAGVVKGMRPGVLTIDFPDPYKELTYDTDDSNRPIRNVTLVYPPLPPTEIELRGLLAEGKVLEHFGVSYRITDVRLGDRLIVGYRRDAKGVWSCDHITIIRRPGGKVPPAPFDMHPKFDGYRWHEYCQALQDFEEKGTPIPAKFLPGYRDKIAPMPREVKYPRIPDAEP
jgi:hypothetical protein